MLMVTTTMRMLNWVHGNTSNSWPVVSLTSSLVPGVGGLEEWLIGSLTTGANSDHGSAGRHDGLSGTRWKSDSGFSTILSVTDDDGGSAGCSGEGASVSLLSFDV